MARANRWIVRVVVACSLMSIAGVAACSTSAVPARSTRSIVALGDSVPRGTNCRCRPYPELTADQLAAATGRRVTAVNDAVAGYTSAGVLRQLRTDERVISDVRAAAAVEIEVGANDVGHSNACGNTVSCYARRLPGIRKNLVAIVGRIHALASGRRVPIVLLDYWSVWLGGRFAAGRGPAYVAAAKEVTARVNAAIRATATRTGSLYVDLRAAFKGPSYAADETRFLSPDGDHPNAAGHRRIAAAADAAVRRALRVA